MVGFRMYRFFGKLLFSFVSLLSVFGSIDSSTSAQSQSVDQSQATLQYHCNQLIANAARTVPSMLQGNGPNASIDYGNLFNLLASSDTYTGSGIIAKIWLDYMQEAPFPLDQMVREHILFEVRERIILLQRVGHLSLPRQNPFVSHPHTLNGDGLTYESGLTHALRYLKGKRDEMLRENPELMDQVIDRFVEKVREERPELLAADLEAELRTEFRLAPETRQELERLTVELLESAGETLDPISNNMRTLARLNVKIWLLEYMESPEALDRP